MGAPFPKVALVSHALPPSPSGQAMALHRMLRGWPADRVCLLSRDPGPRTDCGQAAREAAERDVDVNKITPKFEEFLMDQDSG